jgi:branched-chain amino acid transport system substrate-binding protein
VLPTGPIVREDVQDGYTLVGDFGPGHDAEEAFAKDFKDGGGTIVDSVRALLVNPDFAAYMERVKEAKPAGKTATAALKAFGDLALGKADIGPGDITPDEALASMGAGRAGRARPCITIRPPPPAPPTRLSSRRGEGLWGRQHANFVAVGGCDGMGAIMHAIRAHTGKLDPDATLELLGTYKNLDSPRGPLSIDPETRDIVHNEYLRDVPKLDGQFANVELETVAAAVKDPWKELDKK